MNIYVFTSNSLTNIWAGIGARKWAVAESQANMPGCATKGTNEGEQTRGTSLINSPAESMSLLSQRIVFRWRDGARDVQIVDYH